jgi:hypothetical protein
LSQEELIMKLSRRAFTSLIVSSLSGVQLADGMASAMGVAGTAQPDDDCCTIVELRQYTLRAGQRDALIELFDREFVETQEALGMRIVGQFLDADAPDRFVWIRAFPNMAVRKRALTSFYQGPVWKLHGKRAAATMIDADHVLLLRPVDPPAGFASLPAARAPIGTTATPPSIVTATVYPLIAGAEQNFTRLFDESVRPALRNAGIEPLACFESESAPNDYAPLPVREGEQVFVWFARFESAAAHVAAAERLSLSRLWTQAETTLAVHLKSSPQQLRLYSTARSLLR